MGKDGMITMQIPKTEIRSPRRVMMALDADEVRVVMEGLKAYRFKLQMLKEQEPTNFELWHMQNDMVCIERIEFYLKTSGI